MPEQKEKRNLTKSKIIYYMLNHSVTSKAELAKELNLSMPTVLTNVNELIAKGIIAENGEYESTGGRKAKSIGINKSYCRAMGMIITANHLEMVMVNLGYEIEKIKRVRLKFSSEIAYCSEVQKNVREFLKESDAGDEILGIGVAIPGIIDQERKIVLKSHALKLENYSLSFLEQALGFPVYFENDANAAMLAEEFGHMILVPGGKKCYCGKLGCADAYCAASVLTNDNQISLEKFLEQLESKDLATTKKWEEYLDNLAILISNLRMAYDMDIILGGDVGGVLSRYMIPLGERIMAYNGFDHDVSYMKNCSYEKEASAVGVAKHFFTEYVMQM